jgi:prepilin-type N-terminal cleavage/methylation domain-containing protein
MNSAGADIAPVRASAHEEMDKKPLPIANQNGFTLTEMLISLAIFSIGMLAVISLFTTSFSALRFVRNINAANALGQEMMETLSLDVESGGLSGGMEAIVNAVEGKADAELIEVSTTHIEAKWPDAANPAFKYTLEVNNESYNITAAIPATIANVVVSWDEMGTTRKIYFESLFD